MKMPITGITRKMKNHHTFHCLY